MYFFLHTNWRILIKQEDKNKKKNTYATLPIKRSTSAGASYALNINCPSHIHGPVINNLSLLVIRRQVQTDRKNNMNKKNIYFRSKNFGIFIILVYSTL